MEVGRTRALSAPAGRGSPATSPPARAFSTSPRRPTSVLLSDWISSSKAIRRKAVPVPGSAEEAGGATPLPASAARSNPSPTRAPWATAEERISARLPDGLDEKEAVFRDPAAAKMAVDEDDSIQPWSTVVRRRRARPWTSSAPLPRASGRAVDYDASANRFGSLRHLDVDGSVRTKSPARMVPPVKRWPAANPGKTTTRASTANPEASQGILLEAGPVRGLDGPKRTGRARLVPLSEGGAEEGAGRAAAVVTGGGRLVPVSVEQGAGRAAAVVTGGGRLVPVSAEQGAGRAAAMVTGGGDPRVGGAVQATRLSSEPVPPSTGHVKSPGDEAEAVARLASHIVRAMRQAYAVAHGLPASSHLDGAAASEGDAVARRAAKPRLRAGGYAAQQAAKALVEGLARAGLDGPTPADLPPAVAQGAADGDAIIGAIVIDPKDEEVGHYPRQFPFTPCSQCVSAAIFYAPCCGKFLCLGCICKCKKFRQLAIPPPKLVGDVGKLVLKDRYPVPEKQWVFCRAERLDSEVIYSFAFLPQLFSHQNRVDVRRHKFFLQGDRISRFSEDTIKVAIADILPDDEASGSEVQLRGIS